MSDPRRSVIRDEVFRKVGRNVVNFQVLERTLRALIPELLIQGTVATAEDNKTDQMRKLRKASLGELFRQLRAQLFGEAPDLEDATTIAEPCFRITFKFESDRDAIKARVKTWSSLVLERNRLVHMTLQTYDLKNAEHCERFSLYLDEQHERILLALSELREIAAQMHQARVVFVSWLGEWIEADESSDRPAS